MKKFPGISVLFIILALACSVMGSSLLSSTDGVPRQLRWKGDTIKIALSSSLFRTGQIKAGADTRQAIERSLATWEGAANIRFEVTFSDEQNVSQSGPSGDGISLITIAQSAENVLLFGKQAESHPATTRIFYNGSGEITEADIVLNPFQQFSTDGTFGTFDLESTLTHEIGHLLGLDHSAVFGSTMYPHHGKNGVYAMTQFNARTLSIADLSGIRSLYPENVLDVECCGSVFGRLTNSEREPASGAGLWLESADTGRVASAVQTGTDGRFRFGGISDGSYRVFGGESAGGMGLALSEQSEIDVRAGRTVQLNGNLRKANGAPDVQFIGFNSQLSRVAVRLNVGRSYSLFIGGSRLDADRVKIGSSSGLISVAAGSIVEHSRDENLSVLRFDVTIAPEMPPGDYSLYVENLAGGTTVLIGVLTIEEFPSTLINYSIY